MLCMYMCAPFPRLVPVEVNRERWIPWSWCYGWLWTTMCVLWIKPGSFAWATGPLSIESSLQPTVMVLMCSVLGPWRADCTHSLFCLYVVYICFPLCLCTWAYGDQRSLLSVFVYCSPPHFLRQGLLPAQELTGLVRLAGHRVPGICLLLPPQELVLQIAICTWLLLGC